MKWGAGCWWKRGSKRCMMRNKERSRGEDLALNIPRLVCQQLILVVPLQRGGRHGGKLAVERGLLVPQHHQVLRSDHRPWKTLICRRGRQTICMITSAGIGPSSSICVDARASHQPTVGFIKSCQQQHEAGEQVAFRQRCVSTPQRAPEET